MNWQRFFEEGDEYAEHRDGLSWRDAPIPSRWHRCHAQTRGYFTNGGYLERCACGAIRPDNHGSWLDRNSRRKRPRFAR